MRETFCFQLCTALAIDLYFEGKNEKWGIKPWDATAGEVIVTEAGGVVLEPDGACTI